MASNVYFFVALVIVTASACVAFSGKPEQEKPTQPKPGVPVFDAVHGLSEPVTSEPAYTVVPLTPGYDSLTVSMARGGNAGYSHPDPYWRGGWYGLNLP